jgi:penicillin-binding protein 1A
MNNQRYHRLRDLEEAERRPAPLPKPKLTPNKPANQNQKQKKKLTPAQGARYVFSVVATTFLTLLLIIIITICVVAVALSVYITQFADSMYDVDLRGDFELNYSSFLLVKNPLFNPADDDCEEAEYTELFPLSADENRIWVDLEEIPQHTLDALVATEDKRFFEHAGVDWSRTISLGITEMLGSTESIQGGSTITQQLVRDVTKDNQVNIGRKLREIFRAISLEQKYSKHDILESYLNRVAFGNTVYGVGSATWHYFDKEVSELTIAESAILMGLLPSPVGFNPYANPRRARNRQVYTLDHMFDQGLISYAQWQNALNEPVQFRLPVRGDYFGYIDERYEELHGLQGENPDDDEDLYFQEADWADLVDDPFTFTDYVVRHNWFIDAALKEITNDLAQARDISHEAAARLIRTGGFRIYLTMDTQMQDKLEEVFNDPYLVRSAAYPVGTPARDTIQAAFVIMDMQGNVVAVAGGVGDKPGNDVFNRATQAKRNVGSTIKPFGVYAPAIDMNKITYSTLLLDLAGRIDDPHNPGGELLPWPQNFERNFGLGGNHTAWWALMRSTNTISARTMHMVGVHSAYNFLQDRLGITTLTQRHIAYSPLATGAMEMKLHELAAAYQIFGTGGVYYKPAFYSRVEDHNGNLILEKDYSGSQAIGADSAWIVNRMMETVISDTIGTGKFVYENIPRHIEVVGKTGTANDLSDYLFAGLTPDYVGVLRIGFDDNRAMSERTTGDHWRPPTRVWGEIMGAVIETDVARSFSTLGNASGAVTAAYCPASGLMHGSNCESQRIGFYRPSNIPRRCTHDDATWASIRQEEHPHYKA